MNSRRPSRPESPLPASLDAFLLGTLELDSALELQDRLQQQVANRSDAHGVLFLCDHPPCITIGREGSFADVLIEREELNARQISVRWVNRGGGTFLHLPGQINAYLSVPLDRLQLGLLEFHRALERGLMAVAREFKVIAEPSSEIPGVGCRCGQFAVIGTGVRDWITRGGVHVNVSLTRDALSQVSWSNPDARMTSLATQRERPIAIPAVRESLVRNLAQALGYEDLHLYTGHPLLRRTVRDLSVPV